MRGLKLLALRSGLLVYKKAPGLPYPIQLSVSSLSLSISSSQATVLSYLSHSLPLSPAFLSFFLSLALFSFPLMLTNIVFPLIPSPCKISFPDLLSAFN